MPISGSNSNNGVRKYPNALHYRNVREIPLMARLRMPLDGRFPCTLDPAWISWDQLLVQTFLGLPQGESSSNVSLG